MKNLLKLFSVLNLLFTTTIIAKQNETISLKQNSSKQSTINLYGVITKTNPNKDSTKGAGLALESELLKLKLEVTSDFYRAGGVYKFNPNNHTYIKTGLNLNRQKIYAPDDTNSFVNQYSIATALGYTLYQDIYLELGFSYTSLNGTDIGTNYSMSDEITKQAYIELAKRFKSSIGTIDMTTNYGIVDYQFVNNKSSYGAVADYYPLPYLKLSYGHQHEKENIANTYGLQYGIYFVDYMDNISYNTKQINFGLKIAFENLFDSSTWTTPTNLVPHLSELHRFETIVFGANMAIQSTKGVVEKPKPVIPEPVQQSNSGGGASSNTTVDNFTFTDATNVAISSTQTSNTITVSGINSASAISITGGTYSVNGGAYTSSTGTVNNGDTVTLRHTASASYSTAVNTTLTIGGVSDTYTSTTIAQSTPTISMSSQSVSAMGGIMDTNLQAPTVANVDTNAVYSIVGNPQPTKISINSSTGVITWSGRLRDTTDYSIIIKVVNPDDGGNATATFNLHVNGDGLA